jgi:ATP-dependent DNA helicase RecQ
MGFDKPDLGFVVHFQTPGSVVHYYQQVGRAGRAIPQAFGILMAGEEDEDINAFFRDTAFPPEARVQSILQALEAAEEGLDLRGIEEEVNLRHGQIEKVLKILSVEDAAPVVREASRWDRTPNPWQIDRARIEHLTHQREDEWRQMQAYVSGESCLMRFLANALDDEMRADCGKCAVCTGRALISPEVRPQTLQEAQRFLRRSEMVLEPKKQWPAEAFPTYGWRGGNIPGALRAEEGRILARWREAGWGQMVGDGKARGAFPQELLQGAVEMIRNRWPQAAAVRWITCIPSLRHPDLVPDFGRRLAAALGVPFSADVRKVRETRPQKGMENRYHQCNNLDGAFEVRAQCARFAEPVLLVDDVTDSGWTLSIVAALLRQAGSGPVFPLALAGASGE